MSKSSYQNLNEDNIPIAYPNIENNSDINESYNYSHQNLQPNIVRISSNEQEMVNMNGLDNYGNYITVLVPKKNLDNSNDDNMAAFTAGTVTGGLASCFLCNIL